MTEDCLSQTFLFSTCSSYRIHINQRFNETRYVVNTFTNKQKKCYVGDKRYERVLFESQIYAVLGQSMFGFWAEIIRPLVSGWLVASGATETIWERLVYIMHIQKINLVAQRQTALPEKEVLKQFPTSFLFQRYMNNLESVNYYKRMLTRNREPIFKRFYY